MLCIQIEKVRSFCIVDGKWLLNIVNDSVIEDSRSVQSNNL